MTAIFLQGDTRVVLRGMPEGFFQCVVTSPPYWGLRKYSGEQDLIWGGDSGCVHSFSIPTSPRRSRTENDCPNPNTISAGSKGSYYNAEGGNTCSLCGAWRGAYGLEATPELYVQHTIEILREIRRVLRKDGVVFWSIGDSYSGSGEGGGGNRKGNEHGQHDEMRGHRPKPSQTLKPKDLCLIPFRVAIAAQEDGWWVRSDIIWNKTNPMPESVKDRPTESHEYILMLTQSGTTQYWTHSRKRGTRTQPKPDYIWAHKRTGLIVDYRPVSDRIVKKFWSRRNLWQGHDYYWDADAVREKYTEPMNRWGGDNLKANGESTWDLGTGQSTYRDRNMRPNEAGRNIRSVWTFPTQPGKFNHYAAFPPRLPELCIKSSTSEKGCCSKCGAPWARVVEKEIAPKSVHTNTSLPDDGFIPRMAMGQKLQNRLNEHPPKTIGWRPTCSCNADKVPSIVLDPFAGAGTTSLVCEQLGRDSIGVDISDSYIKMARQRLADDVVKREVSK